MPLPDERPRQSVANLIGRFEQTKRPSTSGTGSRSSSVVSHTTGDSAKEEVKEKREWPPKSSTAGERPPIIIPSSSWTRRNAEAQSSSTSIPDPPATQAGPVEDPAILTPRPSSAASIPDNTKPTPSVAAQEATGAPSETILNTSKTLTATTPKSPGKAPVPKTATTPRTPLKAPTKPQPRPAPVAQPLRPQHTGPTSIAAAARKSLAKPTPVTPNRAKTPSRTPAPAAAPRSKTPSSTRPKTPSGLFAPTAASLARARSNQPPPPTPTKKVTLSNSSADRLSKPTAASLSRARTPISITSSPSRGTAKPTVRGGATRGMSKPRVSTTTRPRKDDVPPIPTVGLVSAATTGAAFGAAGAAVAAGEGHNSDEESYVHDDQGSLDLPEPSVSPVTDEIDDEQDSTNLSRDPRDGLGEVNDTAEEQGIPVDVFDTPATKLQEPDEPTEVPPLTRDLAQELDMENHDFDVDTSATSESETVSISEDRVEEVKVHADDDIEDMVNLLETVSISKLRPASIASIPDEVHEIPDEE